MENLNRLKVIRKKLNLTQTEFAQKLGFKQHNISDMEQGNQKISLDIAEAINKKFSFNGWWVLTGQGDMQDNPISISNNAYSVDILSLKASAGGGIENYSVEVIDNYILDKHFFKTPPQTNKLKIVQVEGDSMETTIQDGAFVVIDESKQGKEDGIYAIILDNQVLIKRLQFRIDGSILIISDNPKYQTQTYNTKDTQVYFSIIGRKILTIQR